MLAKAKRMPHKIQWLLFGIFGVAVFALFVHPDATETANHAWLLLESFFSGNFRSFYGIVAEHQNTLYYLNNAHYNIVVYLLYAAAELPLYLVHMLSGTPPNEAVLTFVGKAMCAVFYAGCLMLVLRIARQLKLDAADSHFSMLLFALWPPVVFSVLVMGQYDVICLFFMLCGLLSWMQNRMVSFALWFGIAIAVKSFPAFLFLPLLLLREKRPLRILLYGACGLWVMLPTTALFYGNTFSMASFNQAMMGRLFAARWPGAREIPVFATLFILLCIVCYCWQVAEQYLNKTSIWVGLCVFGLLFLFVEWHPQWLVLLAPFVVLSTLGEKNRLPWLFVDILLCAGFALTCVAAAPAQLEANLLNWGLLGQLSGLSTATAAQFIPLIDWYGRLPFITQLPTALFSAAVLAHVVLKCPVGGRSLAARLAGDGNFSSLPKERYLTAHVWLVGAVGLGFWLLPTLASWVVTVL